MADPGPRPELAWLLVDRLAVDPSYQRTLDTKESQNLIARIADNFSWFSFQAILAVPQSDRWLIIDGQHRVAAARKIGLKEVPAVIVAKASLADQARAFVGANRDRVPVSAQALFHARLVAGDAEATTVARLCEAAGFEVLRYRLSAAKSPAGKTAAVPALLRCLRAHGERTTAIALRCVGATFNSTPTALRAPFFLAAGRYLSDGGTEPALMAALARHGLAGLESCGRGLSGKTAVIAMTALLRESAVGGGRVNRSLFTDDPRAKRDPGSTDKLVRPDHFGASLTGGSLR